MSSALVLVRTHIHPLDSGNLETYFRDSTASVASVEGFLGAQLWRNPEFEGEHLMIWHYRDIASAEEGLEQVAQIRALPQRQAIGQMPADVTRYQVRNGACLPEGPLLSLSIRVAEPGYANELVEDYERVFAELDFIEGHRQHLIGQNEGLEEEVVGLATWDTTAAFTSSLPAGMIYEVRLYERVV